MFFVFDRKAEELTGGCQLSNIRQGVAQSAASLGYWMGLPYAGRGLMKEAVRALIPFATRILHLHRIEAATMPSNEASIRVLEASGFVREGYARQYLKIAGVWQDHLLFADVADGET
jgi:ribosomal-protein-alanine N-acetyltransferase